MAEQVVFIDSFDHTGPAWRAAKYLHVSGTYTEVTGPYHGVGASFAAQGNHLGPALRASLWDSGAWSGGVRVTGGGWSGGEIALLAAAYWDGTVDFCHHWLTVDSGGTLRVRRWQALPGGPPNTTVLASSAAGAMPLDAWVRLEYRTLIRSDSTSAGAVGCRVNGTEVLSATGLVTHDPQRAIVRGDYFRFGHLTVTADGSSGVGGLGSGGESQAVAFDDVCERHESTLGAALLAYHDDPASPHRVRCLFPTGPGQSAELGLTGAAANWAACDEAPPDGDTSYVERAAVGDSSLLPVDLYATQAAPTIVTGSAKRWLCVWGLASTSDGAQRATVRLRRGGGSETATYGLIRASYPTYRYVSVAHSNTGNPATLTNADLSGLEIGWGSRSVSEAPLAQTYRGTQVVAELWYRPEPSPGRTWVAWLAT